MSAAPAFFADIPDDYMNTTLQNEVFYPAYFDTFMIYYTNTTNSLWLCIIQITLFVQFLGFFTDLWDYYGIIGTLRAIEILGIFQECFKFEQYLGYLAIHSRFSNEYLNYYSNCCSGEIINMFPC